MDDNNAAADILAQKIRHLIITTSGRTADVATIEEFYQALCTALREEAMINWTASTHTFDEKKTRMVFVLSMEYLPGRLLNQNMLNLGAAKLVRQVLAKLGRKLDDVIACEREPGLGHGGLGRLASCFLDSLATHKIPARGYGLRYQYGIFEQEIWDGIQIERPDPWLWNNNPWEQRRDTHAATVRFKGRPVSFKNHHGDEVEDLEHYEEVRAIPYEMPVIGYSEHDDYSVVSLRLWSTKESPRNFQLQHFNAGFFEDAAENTSLTDLLYPNDNTELGKRIRLKQEFLLVSASLQNILKRTIRVFGDLNWLKDKVRIQLNDTHPALAIPELIRTLTKNHGVSWKEAWEISQAVFSFTNHTILREALEEWREARMQELLPRQYRVIQKVNQEFCDRVRKEYRGDEERVRRVSVIENGQVRMAHLAILGSHAVNGVAKLHTEILKKKIFPDFAEIFPNKFLSITNGVSQRRWLLDANPLLSDFISKRIGRGWIIDFSQIAKLEEFASDPESQAEFLLIKRKNKEALLHFLRQENPRRDRGGRPVGQFAALPVDALFDVQIKRFHEYKRQLLNALHLIMVFHELQENPNARAISRFAIFSGKSAPGYARAKQIIDLVYALARDFAGEPALQGKLGAVFVENYCVSKAQVLIPAADLSEQISTAGWEASGTGNIKLAINGALTIGTEDGANIEMHEAVGPKWWPFSFGASAAENEQDYEPYKIYSNDKAIKRAVDALEIGPFAKNAYERDAFGKLHRYLTEQDPFRVLKDLRPYYLTQKKVETLYLQPNLWAETALRNIAAMGSFSADSSIGLYANKIWDVPPCHPDPAVLEKVRKEYSENDRCRIRNGKSF